MEYPYFFIRTVYQKPRNPLYEFFKKLTILYGDDEESIAEYLSRIEQEQIATGLADLNFSKWTGEISRRKFLYTVWQCRFFHPIGKSFNQPACSGKRKDGNKKLLRLLESVPSTTHIVLVITMISSEKTG